MPTTLVPQEVRPAVLKFTAAEIKADVNLIQQVIKAVFIEGVHYGIVPGCGDKKVLLKPGAEKIMTTFRLNGEPKIEDLSTQDEIRYRIRIRITHQITSHEIGWGVGECSSNETKYKWIKADAVTWKGTPEDRRRMVEKGGRGEKPYTVMQIRANISDVANTVLKMAKKRALVDATLTCTAASDVFDQDLDDMPAEIRTNLVQDERPSGIQRASDVAAEKTDAAPAAPPSTPPPAKPMTTMVDPEFAKRMDARFDAPCKNCNRTVVKGKPMIYVADGSKKGGYHVDCVSFSGE